MQHAEEVLSFADTHCTTCKRDENEDCPILASAFCEQPVQWLANRCTAHWPLGEEREPVQQCPHTLELPL